MILSLLRRLCALALALVLGGCAAHASAPRSTSSPPLVAPLAQSAYDRGPQWSPGEREAIRDRLATIFAGPIVSGNAGIAVVGQDGTLLYGRQEGRPRTPASTMKLLVAYASLATLGPEYRFETTFESLAGPDSDGTIHGDVWLVGNGDPTLLSSDLRGGVATLARLGVRRIDGDLVVDSTAFRGPEQNPAWALEDFEYGYGAGTSALSLDWNVVEFRVTPGTIGAPARVAGYPPSDELVIKGGLTTAYTTSFHISREPETNHFTLEGQIAAGVEQKYYRPMVSIPRYIAGTAAVMARERGIELGGEPSTGVAPFVAQTLWRHRSAPLQKILRTMLVESDNHIAEELLRTLGARLGKGTEAGGAAVERALLAARGIGSASVRIVDGSGLAATDRITPVALASLLERAQHDPTGRVFLDDLARVGREGTVRDYPLTVAAGRVRAKTGHIGGVNALAGYVATRHHGRVAFAFIVNDPNADAGSVYEAIEHALDTLSME